MFDRDRAIEYWRSRLNLRSEFRSEDIAELEDHLRNEIEDLVRNGATEREAFLRASEQLGPENDLLTRFRSAYGTVAAITRGRGIVSNHIHVALRSFAKNKVHSAINLIGLAIGLASVATLLLYVQDELSYDAFHDDADRIYRVVVDRSAVDGIQRRAKTPDALGPELAAALPEIESATRFMPAIYGTRQLRRGSRHVESSAYLYADAMFFEIFSFEFLDGSAITALDSPDSILLTESMARALFGGTEIVGQSVELDQTLVTVSGVIADLPRQSHLDFDFLLKRPAQFNNCWRATCAFSYTYFKAHAGADLSEVESRITRLVRQHSLESKDDRYLIQPLAGFEGIHLNSHRLHELSPNSQRSYVVVLFSRPRS